MRTSQDRISLIHLTSLSFLIEGTHVTLSVGNFCILPYMCRHLERQWIENLYGEAYSTSSLRDTENAFTKSFVLRRELVMTVNIPVQKWNATCRIVATVEALIKALLKNNYDPQRRLVWSAKNYFGLLGVPCLERCLWIRAQLALFNEFVKFVWLHWQRTNWSTLYQAIVINTSVFGVQRSMKGSANS